MERKIAEQKTGKEQIEILRRIQKTLKTKEQREGFKKFVQELLDKNILKVSEIEITIFKHASCTVRRVGRRS